MLKNKLANLLGASIIIVLVLGIIGIAMILSGGLLSALGFQYQSFGSFLLFFLLFFIISALFDFIVEGLPNALYHMGRIQNPKGVLFFILDVIVGILVLSGIDYCMDSISIPTMAVVVFAMVSSLATIWLDRKEKEPEK